MDRTDEGQNRLHLVANGMVARRKKRIFRQVENDLVELPVELSPFPGLLLTEIGLHLVDQGRERRP
ncbi:hypothetical protein D3C87_2118720 [compost metagenome]